MLIFVMHACMHDTLVLAGTNWISYRPKCYYASAVIHMCIAIFKAHQSNTGNYKFIINSHLYIL